MLNYEGKTFDMRRCNAVALEVREMGGKREKKVVIFNAPESTEQRRTTTRKRLIWNKPWKSLRSSASKEFDRLALSGPRRDPAETPQDPRRDPAETPQGPRRDPAETPQLFRPRSFSDGRGKGENRQKRLGWTGA